MRVGVLTDRKKTRKVVLEGTHRSQPLNRTVDRVMRLAPILGITRVANVTGLDTVGIPVVMVCRPNSRSVAVSQGKGTDLARARASGLMEAAELYHAETIDLPLRLGSYEELRYQHNIVDVDLLPRRYSSAFHPNLRLLWCEGYDILNQARILVPYEMVHTNYTTPFPDGHGCFIASSNGLASGNDLMEAISHGICEVIERDAATLWKLRFENNIDAGHLNLATVDNATCQQLIAKLQKSGLSVLVWDITTNVKIAAFVCMILPRERDTMWFSAVAIGYGCHPAREIALSRAIVEAAQSRLTLISGARDDIVRERYNECGDLNNASELQNAIFASKARAAFRQTPTRENATIEADVAWELKCLAKAGVKHVIVVDLTKPHFGVSVVRVIIPGLEPILGTGYLAGRRALRSR